ncbi:MAG: CopG family transcriptional regulator [Deltaproteobacteria bacterium]|nr:CopG family transcriptional regulator [Deltaproteobacteria bacterium]
MTAHIDRSIRQGLVGLLRPTEGQAVEQIRAILAEFAAIVVDVKDFSSSQNGKVWTCAVVQASTDVIGAFTGRLGRVPDVRVKSFVL